MPVEHFKSKEAYRKWTAYRHMHGIAAPNLKVAVVAGKAHKVKHSESEPVKKRGRPPKRRDAVAYVGGKKV